MARTKFALVGCGRIATLHTAGYRDNPDAELWGVFDTNAAAAKHFAAEHGIPHVYDSFEAILADDDIAAVELLIPHHLHCEYAIRALQAGKHVSVQKPMAMNLEQCDQMIQAAAETGRKLKVFENFRFYAPHQLAKKLLEDGAIGEPQGIRMKMNNANLGSRAIPKSGRLEGADGTGRTGWDVGVKSWMWRLNDTLAGGGPTVFDDGYHKFSIIMYLLGDVEKVTAWIDETPVLPGVYNDSPAVVMWKHKDRKLYGVWDITSSDKMYIESKYYTCDERIEITGSRGIIWVTRCTATLLPHVAPVLMYRDGELTEFWDMKHDWADSFEASTRDFVEAVRDDREPDLSGRTGREVLKFALATVESARRDGPVWLDEYEDKPVPKKRGLLRGVFSLPRRAG
ncbi:MAG: Gfo/Idh/MocA family oxidoreductase [Nocardioides sp.]